MKITHRQLTFKSLLLLLIAIQTLSCGTFAPWPESERQVFLKNCGAEKEPIFCQCWLGKIETAYPSSSIYYGEVLKLESQKLFKLTEDVKAGCVRGK